MWGSWGHLSTAGPGRPGSPIAPSRRYRYPSAAAASRGCPRHCIVQVSLWSIGSATQPLGQLTLVWNQGQPHFFILRAGSLSPPTRSPKQNSAGRARSARPPGRPSRILQLSCYSRAEPGQLTLVWNQGQPHFFILRAGSLSPPTRSPKQNSAGRARSARPPGRRSRILLAAGCWLLVKEL
jgi:hypothetical protein